jgi:hypothetical protein
MNICAYHWREETGLYHPILPDEWLNGNDGLIEVDATGAAFHIVSTECLANLGPDPYTPMINPHGGYFGEDMSFCKRVRNAGYKVELDTGLTIGHEVEAFIGMNGFLFCNGRPWLDGRYVKYVLGDNSPDELKKLL